MTDTPCPTHPTGGSCEPGPRRGWCVYGEHRLPAHLDAKLSAAAAPAGQLELLSVAQDAGNRCDNCGRYHLNVSYRHAVRAAWCDGCCKAGGLHG